jgi:predicted enzyme related to lactoylglutathione lyase
MTHRFDHLAFPVCNYEESKAFYLEVLGLSVDFDAPEREMIAVKDARDFTLFLYQGEVPNNPDAFMFYFSVPDVHEFHASRHAAGVAFIHEPKAVDWGFGAELHDPDGYRIGVWDEASMPKD